MQKTSFFIEIYGVSARTRGVKLVRTFSGQEGVNFVRTSFMDGP